MTPRRGGRPSGRERGRARCAACSRVLRRSDGERGRPGAEAGARKLTVHVEGRWFRLDGGPVVSCERWQLLQRLLRALLRARIDEPGHPVSPRALLAAGWPEERILPRAARNRLHVALHRLRGLGLGDVVQCRSGGWRLSDEVALELRDEP